MELHKIMTDILDNACPTSEADSEGFRDYFIETHCVGWRIRAKVVMRDSENGNTWEVTKITAVDV